MWGCKCLDDFPRPAPPPLSGGGLKTDIILESQPDLQWRMKNDLGDLPGNGNTSVLLFSELVYLEPEKRYMGDDFPQAGGLVG